MLEEGVYYINFVYGIDGVVKVLVGDEVWIFGMIFGLMWWNFIDGLEVGVD